jgi:hypothetical protein
MSEYLLKRRLQKLGVELPTKEQVKAVITPKKPIPKRSKKMTKEMKEYNKEKAEFIKPGDQCELNTQVCRGEATVIHHTKGRIGKLLRNKKYWKKSCVHCNNYIEIKDKESREKGLKLSKHDPNYKREK